MIKNNKLDSLDKRILSILSKNARIPFLQIARKCKVSGSAIHQRVDRLRNLGILSNSYYDINPKSLGYRTCGFIGIQLNFTSLIRHEGVFDKIKQVKEIVECHHVSGKYSLLVKIYAEDNEHLKRIIIENIQSIAEVVTTETFVSLEEGFTRSLPIT